MYLTMSVKNHLHLKMRFYRFQLKRVIFISEHINNYTASRGYVDEVIENEDKILILLNAFLDE